MNFRPDQSIAVRALRSAAPYIRLYKGQIFVVKIGGALLGDASATHAFMEQVAILHQVGVRVVVVHGGGPQLNATQSALGIEPKIVEGRRVTDEATAAVTVMVLNGTLNTQLLGLCRQLGLSAVGVSGLSAGLITAHKRAPVVTKSGATIDYGQVGDIVSVDATVLRELLDGGHIPVVSPLSCTIDGTPLNINADTVAAAIGAQLGAAKLILCTGAAGILESLSDPSSLVSYTDLEGLARLTKAGSFADGMLPKADAIERAIRGGVRRVHVISYSAPDALLAEVFTNEGTGTLIVADIKALTAAESQAPAGT